MNNDCGKDLWQKDFSLLRSTAEKYKAKSVEVKTFCLIYVKFLNSVEFMIIPNTVFDVLFGNYTGLYDIKVVINKIEHTYKKLKPEKVMKLIKRIGDIKPDKIESAEEFTIQETDIILYSSVK